MADHHHRHHQHRPHRISLPPRTTAISTTRSYPSYPYPSITTPTPTPSKTRLSSFSSSNSKSTKSSISFLFLLLFSLRSLYSLLPFLRSSPSFSLFPFSFLVSLLSFLFSFSFSLFPYSQSTKDPFLYQKQNQPFFSLSSISPPQRKVLLAKSLLLAVVFLLRFQALRYCGAATMILAELSGNVAAKFVAEEQKWDSSERSRRSSSKPKMVNTEWDWTSPLGHQLQCKAGIPLSYDFLYLLACPECVIRTFHFYDQLG